MRKKWYFFVTNIKRNIDNVNGVIGFISLTLTILAALYNNIWFMIVCGLCLLFLIIYIICISIPPPLTHPKTLLGKQIDLKDLDRLDREILKVGVVGCSMAGKSTLINVLKHDKTLTKRTEHVYATIVQIPKSEQEYVALIDGGGQEFEQQFNIIENSDILAILIDHSTTERANVQKSRTDQQEDFIKQLIYFLSKKQRISKIKHIHLLLNKRDVWEKSSNQEKLKEWFEQQHKKIKEISHSIKTTTSYHSNKLSSDLTEFISIISGVQK